MLAKDDQSPVISVSSYLRDLYQLITMLMADKQVMSDEHFRSLSVAFYETEVNRLLVWIATATRQFLDIVTIRGRGRSGGRQPNRALLDFGEFAKYCVLLSRDVEDHGHN